MSAGDEFDRVVEFLRDRGVEFGYGLPVSTCDHCHNEVAASRGIEQHDYEADCLRRQYVDRVELSKRQEAR